MDRDNIYNRKSVVNKIQMHFVTHHVITSKYECNESHNYNIYMFGFQNLIWTNTKSFSFDNMY